MNCPKCNGPLSKKNWCDRCQEDVTIYVKIYKASNAHYNEGLKKAKVRDLTGAIYSLRKSLQLNKKNTTARNLLGLVYYEMGETVAALSEWVLSKHFQPENNDADEYMHAVQSNPSKLDVINQAIKKYNTALISAKQGNDDLAIIQLKKVTNLNPRFIRAHQLLAIIYIKNNENEKARKCLARISKIDVNNTTTLRYLKELGEGISTNKEPSNQLSKEEAKEKVLNQTNSYMPISTYKEDKPNIMAFVNLIIGVIIGLAFGYILLAPTIKSNVKADMKEKQNSYIERLQTKEDENSVLQNNNKDLQSKIDDFKKQVKEYEDAKIDESMYDDLFVAAKLYAEGSKTEAAKKLLKVDEDKFELTGAKSLYKLIKDDTFADMARTLYSTGHSQYSTYKYDEAIKSLTTAIKYDPNNVDAIYFLARSYDQKKDYEKAKKYYKKIIEDFADSKRVSDAKIKLSAID